MTHVKQYGSTGPNLIIIHGLFGNADNWHSIAQSLAENFTVYCVDLPNHGKSAPMEEASYPKMAEAVLAWAEQADLPSFYLLGHSMGGKVAMQMASLTNKIEKLIVVDIAPVDYQASHTTILEGLQVLKGQTFTSRKDADKVLAQYEPNMAVRQFLLKNLSKTQQGLVLDLAVEQIADAYPTILKKPQLTLGNPLSTLFIKGEHSDYIIADYQDAIMDAFPNASFKILAGTGHWLHAEKPIPFTGLVRRFLLDG
ncbi:alpha/beta fold hydrolase [Marinomonas sp. THO17]|uniref:alpha/beta fold hydrolase n=1 Tax=Marinomonas sp. THO17 TaxID=3149048 RepID=UPI00336C1BC6